MIGKITTLAHESGNHTMKGASLESKSLFHGTQGPKVLGRFGNDIGPEFHDDTSGGVSTNGHVKIHFRFGPVEDSSREREWCELLLHRS